jgi:signal transduction histidine kinase
VPFDHPKLLAEAILQQNPVAFVILDRNGRVIFVNEAASQLAWKNPSHTIIDAQCAPEIWGNAQDFAGRAIPVEEWPILLALRGIKTVGQEIRMVRPDDSYRDISISAAPLRTEDTIIGGVASVIDITERRLAEQKLTAMNAQLEELASERARGIHLMHLIGLSANNITDIRDMFQITLTEICSHLRWPVGFAYIVEVPGRLHGISAWYSSNPEKYENLRRVTASIDFASKESLIGQVLRNGTTVFMPDIASEELFLRKEMAQQASLKSCLVIPIMVQKQVAAILEFFHVQSNEPQRSVLELMDVIAADLGRVIEQKRTEKKLREKERLAEMGTIAAIFAHELATPLNGISSNAQLLTKRLPAEYQDLMNNLNSEIYLLESLLNQFRSLRRLGELKLAAADFRSLLDRVVKINVPYWSELGIRVVTEFAPTLLLLDGDEDKLHQVILNLSKNAIESMPDGGELALRTYSSGDDIVLEVSDTGLGIAEGVDVFQLFTTTKTYGTGIGLYVARQIVSAHNGSITYVTEQGKGTTFRVTLPKKRNATA